MKKVMLLAVSFLLCVGKIYAEGIGDIQTRIETEKTKVIVSWSMTGCFYPTDSIIINKSQKTACIYRTETYPQCDIISHEKDSFYVDNGVFDELSVQLCKRSSSEGADGKPVYEEYFVHDTKLLYLSKSGLADIRQEYSMYYDIGEDRIRLQSDKYQTLQLTISSLNGQTIEQKTIVTNEPIYIGYLPTGTYLFVIDKINIFKIIKE